MAAASPSLPRHRGEWDAGLVLGSFGGVGGKIDLSFTISKAFLNLSLSRNSSLCASLYAGTHRCFEIQKLKKKPIVRSKLELWSDVAKVSVSNMTLL